jgi:DNA repair protein RecO (recombination protein O)
VVRSLPYAEADVVATLFTEDLGLVTVLARGARTFRKGAPVVLEPMHTLCIEAGEPAGADLLSLRSSAIHVARRSLTADLDIMQAAGRALRWLRLVVPARTPEPETWMEITLLLDSLENRPPRASMQLVSEFGIALIGAMGFALALGQCVVCGRSCGPGRSAYVDPARGGIVCRGCGGADFLLPAGTRDRLAEAGKGSRSVLMEEDVKPAVELVEAMLRAHFGVDPGGKRGA